MDTALARELSTMAEEDQRVRAELARDGHLYRGYHPRLAEVNSRNVERLQEIIEQRGWPGRSLVGERAARAAWLVLQHAIAFPAVMRSGLRLLSEAAARGEVSQAEVAMLEDRIRVLEGRPQRFGTQYEWDERGEMSPLPIEDPAGVDERRLALGLPRLAASRQALIGHHVHRDARAVVDNRHRIVRVDGHLDRVGAARRSTGEVRGAMQAAVRAREAQALGFKKIVMPSSNTAGLEKLLGLRVVGVRSVDEALAELF